MHNYLTVHSIPAAATTIDEARIRILALADAYDEHVVDTDAHTRTSPTIDRSSWGATGPGAKFGSSLTQLVDSLANTVEGYLKEHVASRNDIRGRDIHKAAPIGTYEWRLVNPPARATPEELAILRVNHLCSIFEDVHIEEPLPQAPEV